ncbi:MAG: response regulator transcription factor [Lachnospiraceae bacterium]|nr:response regulator transcription factor [Lachnospiraceae bacterium]
MYKVLLVDDETMLLDSLEIILSMNGMEIAGKAHDGNEALALLEETSCDIALVDLNMKGMGGIELIGHLKKRYPETRVLVLTTFYDDANITDAISGGADGYLLKDSGKDAILGAIRQIMGGVSVLDPKVMQRLMALAVEGAPKQSRGGQEPVPTPAYGEFTEREQEIAALLVEGLTNRQIADRLYISEGTVKNYISTIYDKTGIHDRVKLVVALKG